MPIPVGLMRAPEHAAVPLRFKNWASAFQRTRAGIQNGQNLTPSSDGCNSRGTDHPYSADAPQRSRFHLFKARTGSIHSAEA